MSVFGEVVPSNFTVCNTPRETGRGGGVDTIFNDIFICTKLQFDHFFNFELQVSLSVEHPNLTRILFQSSLCF